MMTAHILGVPVEEWMVPLVASGGGVLVALGAAIRRFRPRP